MKTNKDKKNQKKLTLPNHEIPNLNKYKAMLDGVCFSPKRNKYFITSNKKKNYSLVHKKSLPSINPQKENDLTIIKSKKRKKLSELIKPNFQTKYKNIPLNRNFTLEINNINNSSLLKIQNQAKSLFMSSFQPIKDINSLFSNFKLVGEGSYAKALLVKCKSEEKYFILKTFKFASIKNAKHINRIMVNSN